MVKMRCRIAEEEEESDLRRWPSCAPRYEEFVPDAEERDVGRAAAGAPARPRRGTRGRRQGGPVRGLAPLSSSGWRSRPRRSSIFEDLHWADAALLDFIEYLLDWSRNHPIFVLTLARPEFAERPTDLGRRSSGTSPPSTSSRSARRRDGEALAGLVPGCPRRSATAILERAQGVPLYAVETVRMLLDRGLLRQDGHVYRLTGPVEKLEVPETLHALIAARLDGLSADERRLAPGWGGPGEDLHEEGAARGTLGAAGGPRSSRSSSPSPARKSWRVQADPTLTRARPVRLPAGPRSKRWPTKRSRSTTAVQGTWPRRLTERRVRRGRRRSRRSARLPLPARPRGRRRRGGRGEVQGTRRKTRSARAGERAIACRDGEARRYFEQRSSSRTTTSSVRHCWTERVEGDDGTR